MITIRAEDLTLGLSLLKISSSNPETETRTTRHPFGKMASTQIGTEIKIQIHSITKTDQATPGKTDQITVSIPSKTSMLDQRTLILSTTETLHRATTCLHPPQFNSSTIRDKM